jgi:hypothetical protein
LPTDILVEPMLLEHEIRDLCDQAVRTEDEGDALRILEELRVALHKHIEAVRDKLIMTSTFSVRSDVSAKQGA